MNIKNNLDYVNLKISEAVKKRKERFKAIGQKCVSDDCVIIAAASKYVDGPAIIRAYDAGLRIFGENKVQDLKEKYEYIKSVRPEILDDLQFNVIGHLQTNKIRDAVNYSVMIQSVDSIKLARKINEYCEKNDKNIDVLIEIKTSPEETKTGIEISAADELAAEIASCSRLRLVGVMTMAVFSPDVKEVEKCFIRAYEYFKLLTSEYGAACRILSMGMSEDFELAVECGANMIRAGRILFK